MAGSFTVTDAELVDITRDQLHIDATVQDGRKMSQEKVRVALDSDPVQGMVRTYPTLPKLDPFVLEYASKVPVDNFVRRMIRLCNIVKAYEATGKLIQLGVQMGGKGVGKLVCGMNLLILNTRSEKRIVILPFFFHHVSRKTICI